MAKPIADRAMSLAKGVRDLIVRPPLVQEGLRRAPMPPAILNRLPPTGPHRLHVPTSGQAFTYVAHRDDIMARQIIWDDLGSWERTTTEVLADRLMSAQRFWDIGAYAGIYSLIGCAVNSTLEVVAVEPLPLHASWLETNIVANGWQERITIVRAAVSPLEGSVDFTIADDDITASGIGVTRAGRIVRVPTRSLGGLAAPPDVIKIDVEGHEVEALRSGLEMLAQHRPTVVVECLNRRALSSVMELLHPLGYQFEHLGAHGVRPISAPIEVPSAHANFLATCDRGPV